MHLRLDIKRVIEAINLLSLRIEERFPMADLLNVCKELELVAKNTETNLVKLSKPYLFFRISFYVLVFITIGALIFTFMSIHFKESELNFDNFITVSEALLNEIVMVGFSFYFLFKLEDLIKQKRILASLQELRSIAHVIDMHQLTKDASMVLNEKTLNSPKRELSKFQLGRYLDYCCEMLSLTSKVAATYGLNSKDEMVLKTMHDIEILSTSLSSKIWQKIEINKLST